MRFTTITKANVKDLSNGMLQEAILHYRVIEANALQVGALAAGRHRRELAASCGDAKEMLEEVLWPEVDRRRRVEGRRKCDWFAQ